MQLKWGTSFPPFLLGYLCCFMLSSPSPKREAGISSAPNIVYLFFRTRTCSGFAKHLSSLLCSIILLPSGIFSPCCPSFVLTVQVLLLAHIHFPVPRLCKYTTNLFVPLHLYTFNIPMLSCVTKCLYIVVSYAILVCLCLYLRQANNLLKIFLLCGCNRPLLQLHLPLSSYF